MINAQCELDYDDFKISVVSDGSCVHELSIDKKANILPLKYISRRYWVPSWSDLRTLDRAIRSSDIVHVHAYWSVLSIISISMAFSQRKTVILTPRGTLDKAAIRSKSSTIKTLALNLLLRRQIENTSGVHFQTQRELDGFAGKNIDLDRVLVQSNGVDVPASMDRKNEIDIARQLRSDGVSLLYFGRIDEIKGINLQIDALKIVRDGGVDAKLHLVGPDYGALSGIMSQAKLLGMENFVVSHDPVFGPAKYDLLRSADAVIMSSVFENNSNVALEVLAAGGRLIATTNLNVAGEDLVPGVVGVQPTAEAIAQGILQALHTDSSDIRTLTVEHMIKRFSWKSRAVEMYDYYAKIDAKRHRVSNKGECLETT